MGGPRKVTNTLFRLQNGILVVLEQHSEFSDKNLCNSTGSFIDSLCT